MKLYTLAGVIIAAIQILNPAYAAESCETKYATTSTAHVPTTTLTKTTEVEKTHTVEKRTTTTITQTTTFTIYNASTTTTVPTPSGFTPIISASSAAGSSKRDAPVPRNQDRQAQRDRRRAATTRYPHKVICTTTLTEVHTTKVTSTLTVGVYTGVTTTITTNVATATVSAACFSDNIIDKFDGNFLDTFVADHSIPLCYLGATGSSGVEACLSAETCCEAAQQSGYSGWQFTNFTGQSNVCQVLAGGSDGEGDWEFFAGPGNGHVFFGNTGYGGGVYGGTPPT